MDWSGELFMRSREGYFLCCELLAMQRNKRIDSGVSAATNPSRQWLLYSLHDMMGPYMTIKQTIFTYQLLVTLALRTRCWRHSNQILQLWRRHVKMILFTVIFTVSRVGICFKIKNWYGFHIHILLVPAHIVYPTSTLVMRFDMIHRS